MRYSLMALLLSGCSMFDPQYPEEHTGKVTHTELYRLIHETRNEYQKETGELLPIENQNMPFWLRDYYVNRIRENRNTCHKFALKFLEKLEANNIEGKYVEARIKDGKYFTKHAMVYVDGFYVDSNRQYPYLPEEVAHYEFKK